MNHDHTDTLIDTGSGDDRKRDFPVDPRVLVSLWKHNRRSSMEKGVSMN